MRRALIVLSLLALLAGCSGGDPEPAPATQQTAPTEPSAPGAPIEIEAVQASKPPVPPEDLAVVREYTALFYDGELERLHARFTAEMREVVPLEQLQSVFDHAVENYGAQTRVIGEESQVKDDYRGFVRWAHFDKTEEVIEIQWILKANDEIAGFFIRPAKRKTDITE